MDALVLCYNDEPLREFVLARPLEIGSGFGCDIVIHDASVRERELLVIPRGGAVLVHRFGEDRRRPRPLRPNEPLRLGRAHSLVRIPDSPTKPRAITGITEAIGERYGGDELNLGLVVGKGSDARRVTIDGFPLTVGTAPHNDVVLVDRAVSSVHCRLEPSEEGLRLRDLGSRNGTFVDGVRITLARVDRGSTLRIGRTDLRIVARGAERSSTELVAESEAMCEILGRVEKVAPLKFPVLITGESGTGKEGIARALHASSPRSLGPFVPVNAGGLPASLIESELFGHEKGAFTGAVGVRRGVFEQAHGGTLFLDEIGELPLDLQARLLRVLETWEVRRVGAERPIEVSVRLVCATHRDLAKMVEQGTLRQDLFFRIAQLVIDVPPLRRRPADVQALAMHFLASAAEQLGPRTLGKEAVARLVLHDWPGNVRELRNVILRAAVDCAGATIIASDIERALGDGSGGHAEDSIFVDVLEKHHGNLAAAARSLGMPRTTLRDRLRAERKKRKRS